MMKNSHLPKHLQVTQKCNIYQNNVAQHFGNTRNVRKWSRCSMTETIFNPVINTRSRYKITGKGDFFYLI